LIVCGIMYDAIELKMWMFLICVETDIG